MPSVDSRQPSAAATSDHSADRSGRAASQAASAAQRSNKQVERCLAVGGHALERRHVERCSAVHDRHPDVVGVLADVVLGEGGAVRGPVEVDQFVAERVADRVEVVGGDAARVLAGVGLDRRQPLV